ncbi:hypothetical protein [Caldinitratiruptor microaerophilus]|uniref:Uncharacterized protein n=1 Tax=Caldinitratiruptor microaerophilus TaxID=671077 RepID=A0AA35G9N5_9FIRM|nr:hypothetical protein [Caldinitratiruptor microaerophilus]BDG62271.1 hypothetical protein caldi_33610 [Caldinitratiruptor microaerophilus]
MDPWERRLADALRDVPEWPGDPEQLWARVEPRLRRPLWRRLVARAGLVPAAALAAALVLLWRPAPTGIPGAEPAAGAGGADPAAGIRASAGVLDPPEAGRPLRFAVVVGTAGGRPVQVDGGVLEVRAGTGALVWQAPLPELALRELRGPEAVRTHIVWPGGPEPGHYRAEVSVRPAGMAGGAGVGVGFTEFFVPFPPGSRRVGEVPLGGPQTRAGVTAVPERLRLTPDLTRLHFVLQGERLAGGFQWTLRTPDGTESQAFRSEYRLVDGRLEGIADFEPTPAWTRRLILRLHRVGVHASPSLRTVEELPHTWEWEVSLDPAKA